MSFMDEKIGNFFIKPEPLFTLNNASHENPYYKDTKVKIDNDHHHQVKPVVGGGGGSGDGDGNNNYIVRMIANILNGFNEKIKSTSTRTSIKMYQVAEFLNSLQKTIAIINENLYNLDNIKYKNELLQICESFIDGGRGDGGDIYDDDDNNKERIKNSRKLFELSGFLTNLGNVLFEYDLLIVFVNIHIWFNGVVNIPMLKPLIKSGGSGGKKIAAEASFGYLNVNSIVQQLEYKHHDKNIADDYLFKILDDSRYANGSSVPVIDIVNNVSNLTNLKNKMILDKRACIDIVNYDNNLTNYISNIPSKYATSFNNVVNNSRVKTNLGMELKNRENNNFYNFFIKIKYT
uniref:Uncharacterized protein n=1 Tax=Drosophila-associated filamentous virus TaxID=2743186 RepID=A0A6M9U010_9VIRU|nr:putative protein 54 [Drosophila-associated filamentous virus]